MSSLFKSRLVAKELPFSTYLANQGWKVADIPLHPDITSPEELLKLPAASCGECARCSSSRWISGRFLGSSSVWKRS
ncbi:MAG: kinase/pyrophosphorylase [Deltaproteobacteria bacterium]|nr:kinase/pyrophosphorylase [Deltaproteobacteria bacterium]